jgi:hypothetical protein
VGQRIVAVLGLLAAGIAVGVWPAAHAGEVPYVPTPANVVDAMLSIANVGPRDYVIDLGSGDGRIVIAAAKRYQARGLGIDYDQTLIAQSRANAAREAVSDKVKFLHQDIFASDFRGATVLTMYLLPEVNLQWDLGDWEPDRRLVIQTPGKTVWPMEESTVYLWIVPARIAGHWRGTLAGPHGEEPVVVEFVQRFQAASANVRLRGFTLAGSSRLRGNSLSLRLERSPWMPGSGPLSSTLRVAGGRIQGEVLDGDERYLLRARRLVD